MITVILAAGHSKRFKEAGWPKTKTILPMPDDRTLLEWQLERLPPSRQVIYIGRKEYRKWEYSYIMKYDLLAREPLPIFCHWIRKPTAGPLDGIWQMRSFLYREEELLITYNDEILEAETYKDFITNAREYGFRASVVAFDSQDERYTRIPGFERYACGCTYWFASGKDFVNAMRKSERKKENGVPDAVYQTEVWGFFLPPLDEIIELGTPEQYKTWMAEQGKPVEEW